MQWWQTAVIALIPTTGAVVAIIPATRDLRLRRQTDITDRFVKLIATAHGRPIDRDAVGVAEQVAVIYLLASLARRNRWLRPGTRAMLVGLSAWSGSSEHTAVAEAAKQALRDVPVRGRFLGIL
jgi:hypothetical protein